MNTILGILITTTLLFIWGFLYWGINQIPYSSLKQTANDATTQQIIRDTFPESGSYHIPDFRNDPDALSVMFEQGPIGFVHINLEGRPQMDRTIMINGFLLNLVMVTLLAIFFRIARASEFRDFVKLSLTVGAIAVVLIDVGDIIWWQTSYEWKMWQIIYNFSVFVIAGHLLGIFMKKKLDSIL